MEEARFRDIEVGTMIETIRFPSPEGMVADIPARQAACRDVRDLLGAYLHGRVLTIPLGSISCLPASKQAPGLFHDHSPSSGEGTS